MVEINKDKIAEEKNPFLKTFEKVHFIVMGENESQETDSLDKVYDLVELFDRYELADSCFKWVHRSRGQEHLIVRVEMGLMFTIFTMQQIDDLYKRYIEKDGKTNDLVAEINTAYRRHINKKNGNYEVLVHKTVKARIKAEAKLAQIQVKQRRAEERQAHIPQIKEMWDFDD